MLNMHFVIQIKWKIKEKNHNAKYHSKENREKKPITKKIYYVVAKNMRC